MRMAALAIDYVDKKTETIYKGQAIYRVNQDRVNKEIGDLLNISEGTSKSQYSRAKAYLQKIIPDTNR